MEKFLEQYLGKFERSGFEIYTPRTCSENEPVVDVNHVPVRVDQNIPVVTVLYLEQETDERVSGKTPNEILLRLRKAPLECLLVKGEQIRVPRSVLLDPVERLGVGEELDDPGALGGHDNLVRAEPETDPSSLEDLPELVDDLHRDELLAQIVSALDDDAPALVGGEVPVR